MALYLLGDICLLAEVFQAFLNNSLNEYQSDPAYFLTAPKLAWIALFKHICRPIPLMTDPEMYRMIKPNICHASVCYALANKLIGSLYDSRQPTLYIMEVIANHFYDWAMSQKMPDCDFE